MSRPEALAAALSNQCLEYTFLYKFDIVYSRKRDQRFPKIFWQFSKS